MSYFQDKFSCGILSIVSWKITYSIKSDSKTVCKSEVVTNGLDDNSLFVLICGGAVVTIAKCSII